MRVHEAELEEELTRITGTHFTPGAVEDIPLRFHEFAPADSAPDLIAVDGSYSFLLNLASWWLAILTVGALRYTANGSYVKAAQRVNHRVVAVSTLEEYVAKQTEIHRHIFEFTRNRKDQHNEMVNEFRRWEEAKLSMQMAADHDNLIIAVDGVRVHQFGELLSYLLNHASVGQQVVLKVLRGDRELEIPVTLGPRP